VRRAGVTVTLVTVCVASAITPRGSNVDVVVCTILGGAVALTAVVSWLYGVITLWWTSVDPNPVTPLQRPRYWPGSKADLAQRAVKDPV